MKNVLSCEIEHYFITVICFADNLSTLPTFYGSKLLVVDRISGTLSTYHWTPINPLKLTSEENLKLKSERPLSRNSISQALRETIVTVVIAGEDPPHLNWLIDCLTTNQKQSSHDIAILATWPSIESSDVKTIASFFDTLISASDQKTILEHLRSVIEMIHLNYMVAVDIADIRLAFTDDSLLIAKAGCGSAKGNDRATTAITKALHEVGEISPDDLIFTAIIAGEELSLEEYCYISQQVEDRATSSSRWVMVGCVYDPTLELTNEIKVVVIVSSPTEPCKELDDYDSHSAEISMTSKSGEFLDTPAFLRKSVSD